VFVTRISRYIRRSVLSAVSHNRARTWNVLHAIQGALLYILGAEYSRQLFEGSGVCMFIYKALKVSINLHEFCEDKEFEMCANF
jgi:hypothetical protein